MDIGIQEILLISVLALIVLGPERLPVAVRTVAIWLGRLKRSFNDLKADIEREIDADDIRRQIHNENVLHELEKARTDIEGSIANVKGTLDSTASTNDDSSQPS